jgi:hypothetical protein
VDPPQATVAVLLRCQTGAEYSVLGVAVDQCLSGILLGGAVPDETGQGHARSRERQQARPDHRDGHHASHPDAGHALLADRLGGLDLVHTLDQGYLFFTHLVVELLEEPVRGFDLARPHQRRREIQLVVDDLLGVARETARGGSDLVRGILVRLLDDEEIHEAPVEVFEVAGHPERAHECFVLPPLSLPCRGCPFLVHFAKFSPV